MKTKKHYDQTRMITLWNKGKSVEQIAADQNCSPIWARRVLATKAPDQYKAGLETRHAASTSTALVPAVKVAITKSSKGAIGRSEVVETIARAVAGACFAGAQYVPQPTTREEMFNNIKDGLEVGFKKAGIGFHA